MEALPPRREQDLTAVNEGRKKAFHRDEREATDLARARRQRVGGGERPMQL